jgi:hypothetical protein
MNSVAVTGRFRTAPADRADVALWSTKLDPA